MEENNLQNKENIVEAREQKKTQNNTPKVLSYIIMLAAPLLVLLVYNIDYIYEGYPPFNYETERFYGNIIFIVLAIAWFIAWCNSVSYSSKNKEKFMQVIIVLDLLFMSYFIVLKIGGYIIGGY
jgi:ABC-type transport system involved in multi-copper enzyme maturation permease subunit